MFVEVLNALAQVAGAVLHTYTAVALSAEIHMKVLHSIKVAPPFRGKNLGTLLSCRELHYLQPL